MIHFQTYIEALMSKGVDAKLNQLNDDFKKQIDAIKDEMRQAMQPFEQRIKEIEAKRDRIYKASGGDVTYSPLDKYGGQLYARLSTPRQKAHYTSHDPQRRRETRKDDASDISRSLGHDQVAVGLYHQIKNSGSDGVNIPIKMISVDFSTRVMPNCSCVFIVYPTS